MANEIAELSLDQVELAILGEGEMTIPVEDAETMSREISYRILAAQSEDELFTQEATESANDLLGVPLLIKNVRWRPSRVNEGGPTVFALIEATDMQEGNHHLITCGGRNVMSQLFQAARLNLLPMENPLKFVAHETNSGFTTLWLTKA